MIQIRRYAKIPIRPSRPRLNGVLRCLLAVAVGVATGVFGHAQSLPAVEIVDASQPVIPGTQPHFTTPPGPKIGFYINRPDAFFQSDAGKQFVDNMVGWQNADGGWYKNFSYTTTRPAVLVDNPSSGPPGDDDAVWHKVSTFDNSCTYSEMRVLARAYRVTQTPAYKASFDRALNYCFAAQYPNGGWPQRFPLQDNYGARITFNDGAMTGVMSVLKDVVDQQPDFAFCTDAQRTQAKAAFDRGIECILKCQYVQHGKLTVWGQQHDEHTLIPASARSFELAGLSASESVGVLQMLESIDPPDQRIRDAIEAAHVWYEASKILGKRIANVPGQGRTMIDDPNAPPLWARYNDLDSNQPFVAGRDGIARARLEELQPERRNGYAWYGDWGRRANADYLAWKSRLEPKAAASQPAP